MRFLISPVVISTALVQLCSSCSTESGPLSVSAHDITTQADVEGRVVPDIAKNAAAPPEDARLNVRIHNSRSSLLYAYVTGIDPSSGDYYILQSQGSNSFVWEAKPTGSSPVPEYYTLGAPGYEIHLSPGKNTTVYLPSYAASGRIYITEEQLRFGTTLGGPNEGFVQPSVSNPSLPEFSTAFQFLEFTHLPGNFYADITNMDFVSIPLGLGVVSSYGDSQTVPGLVTNATELICHDLEEQNKRDGYNWANLCFRDDNNKLIRVLSPTQYLAIYPTDNLSSYYDSYVDAVWDKYQSMNLTINTQDSDPTTGEGSPVEVGSMVSCSVSGSVLSCHEGSNRYQFAKPTTTQIFGCTQDEGSPFIVDGGVDNTQAEIVPRLCAAFHRSTLLLPGGHIQPPANITADSYYSGKVTNHYARIVHKYQKEGMGYAFAYDDANPTAPGLDNATANAAGVIKEKNPEWMYVTVGG